MSTSPGHLTSVMLRALAAELSDPGRFSRAKGYARDGAVHHLVIDPGELRAEVRGSRFEPYHVIVDVEPAQAASSWWELVPDRDEVWAECTCPDDAAFGFCKHSLATLLAFAEAVAVEPSTLASWRTAAPPRTDDEDAADAAMLERFDDVLALALTAPSPFPATARLPARLPVAMAPGDELTAEVLADALSALRSR